MTNLLGRGFGEKIPSASGMDDEFYTQVAGHSFELAKVFSLMVGSPPVPTPTGVFAIELTTPHGPSTGGGAQALQHITFVHGDLTIVVGTLDWVAGIIELRGFDHIAELYRRRWDKLLPIARGDYEVFTKRLYHFAKVENYKVDLKEHAPPRDGGTPARASRPTASPPSVARTQTATKSSSNLTRSKPPTSSTDLGIARPRTLTSSSSLAVSRTASRSLPANALPSGTARRSSASTWIIVAVALVVVAGLALAGVYLLRS